MRREEFEEQISAAASRPFRIELRDGLRISLPREIKFWIGTSMCDIGILKRGWLDRAVSVRMDDVASVVSRKPRR